MNKLADFAFLKNKYFVLRHGESEANVARLITSDPMLCISNYGLTWRGRKQIVSTIKKAMSRGWLDSETLIHSSDFCQALAKMHTLSLSKGSTM